MTIPIPVGRKISVTASGKVIRNVVCSECKTEFLYELKRTVEAEANDYLWLNKDGAAQRARAAALERLEIQMAGEVDPVPCPNCGFYQADMVAAMKDSRSTPVFGFGLVAVIILMCIAFYWAINLDVTSLYFIGTAVGVAVLTWCLSTLLQSTCTPNRRYYKGQGARLAATSRGVAKPELLDL